MKTSTPSPASQSRLLCGLRRHLLGLAALVPAVCAPSALAEGSTIETATFLNPGTRQASLTDGDVDWYRFTTTSNGYFAIYSQGLTDTSARLYDAAGTYLYVADDNLGEGYNFKIERQLSAGTYFLRVVAGTRGARTGNYSITLRTQESAPWVSGTSRSGHLTPGQFDFVRVGVQSSGLVDFFSTGLTDTKVRIFDAAGTYLYLADDNLGAGYNYHITRPAFASGDYLLVIEPGHRGARTGAYTAHVLRPEDAEPIQDGVYTRSLSPVGDVDHFRFFVPSRREVRLWTTGTTDTQAQIYDAAGVYRYISDDNSGSGYNFSLRRTLDPGEYFLRVRAGYGGSTSGTYQLHVAITGSPSAGPSPANPSAAMRASLLRQRAALQKRLQRARTPQAKRSLRNRINVINRRLRAL